MEWLSKNNSRFAKVYDPKRINAAFADEITLKLWKEEVGRASMRQLDKIQTD